MTHITIVQVPAMVIVLILHNTLNNKVLEIHIIGNGSKGGYAEKVKAGLNRLFSRTERLGWWYNYITMCGAFSILHPFRDVSARFNAGYNDSREIPRYNIRPSQPVPVILNTDHISITYAVWGIHPTYDKTHKMFFINARDDSLLKPTWKHMLSERRCLIPADGFYEWQKLNQPRVKIPYRFELKSKDLFAFAGLWHEEFDNTGQTTPHCVIITTEPNDIVAEVHDRMPAMLRREDEQVWLNPDTDVKIALEALKPYPEAKMHRYQVSTLVNSPQNDSEEIIKPVG